MLIFVVREISSGCLPKLTKITNQRNEEPNLNTAFLGQFEKLSPAHQYWDELKSPQTKRGPLKLAHFFSATASQTLDALNNAEQMRSKSLNSSSSSASDFNIGALFKKARSSSLGASSAKLSDLSKNHDANASSSNPKKGIFSIPSLLALKKRNGSMRRSKSSRVHSNSKNHFNTIRIHNLY
ncbi:hypothetical protein niasHT_024906 [Heterodera trifolii]|uniref:Uncharacterized protein n=1 Tax=Heterodera trifolii TaxID=157864 RepID=A0ABD2JYK6_9BILA